MQRLRPKIALSLQGEGIPKRYFSFKLKQRAAGPEWAVYKGGKRIFAISNIRGDIKGLYRLLIKTGVIDKSLNWTFDDGHLVILGNCMDLVDQSVECLWLIYSLEEQAKRLGGYIHYILGDEECENLTGQWRNYHPYYASRKDGPTAAIYLGNYELENWLRSKNIIEKIGDNIFVHGGVSRELVEANLSISDINKLARPYYGKKAIAFQDPRLSLIYKDGWSPLPYGDDLINDPSEESIEAVCSSYKASAIITGHSLVSAVSASHGGKVINVNVNQDDESLEGLYIVQDKFYRIRIHSKKERIK